MTLPGGFHPEGRSVLDNPSAASTDLIDGYQPPVLRSSDGPQYMHVPAPPDGVTGAGQQLGPQGAPRSLAQYSAYVAQLMERNGMGAERMPHTHERMMRMIEGRQPFVSADRLRQFVNNPQAMQALCNNLQRYLRDNPSAPDAERIRASMTALGQIISTGNITANQIEALSRTEVGAYAAAADIHRHFGRHNMLDQVEAASAQANMQAGFRLAGRQLVSLSMTPDLPGADPRFAPGPRHEPVG